MIDQNRYMRTGFTVSFQILSQFALLQLGTGVQVVGSEYATGVGQMWEVPEQYIAGNFVGAGVMVSRSYRSI